MASPLPMSGLQGGPPPSSDPAMPPQPTPGGGMGGLISGEAPPNGDAGDNKSMLRQVVKMAGDIDQALSALSQVYAADGGTEVGEAQKLIQSATAKFLSKYGESPASSPTSTGSNFPGGGFTSNPQ